MTNWFRTLAEAGEKLAPEPAVDRLEAILVKTRHRRQLRRVGLVVSVFAVAGVVVLVPRLRTGQAEQAKGGAGVFEASAVRVESPRSLKSRSERAGPDAKGIRNHGPGNAEDSNTGVVEDASAPLPAEPTQRQDEDDEGVGTPERVEKAISPGPKLSASQLLALAHQARRARDAKAARDALREVRARFGRSAAAAQATFLLGRVELDLAKDEAAAVKWFECYVDEFPDGPLVSEARGRRLAHAAETGAANVRSLAAAYLEHHADGPHAELARAALDSP